MQYYATARYSVRYCTQNSAVCTSKMLLLCGLWALGRCTVCTRTAEPKGILHCTISYIHVVL